MNRHRLAKALGMAARQILLIVACVAALFGLVYLIYLLTGSLGLTTLIVIPLATLGAATALYYQLLTGEEKHREQQQRWHKADASEERRA